LLSLSVYLPNVKINKSPDPHLIWCAIRKKWYTLTPEEVVRQCAILYCLELGYPSGRISVEKQIRFNKLSRRYDIVVHNKKGHPEILVECKAMHLPIHQSTLDQAISYNQTLTSTFLWLTNGHENLFFKVGNELVGIKPLKDIPCYRHDSYLEEE
jgi:hypothetical protein